MELKWLEDLISVAEKGHFARAAEDRLITQSALSRRIKSLEVWAGAELLDRSEHPIKLTTAGEEFYQLAREIIQKSYQGRALVAEHAGNSQTGITIACLHTLALYYVPNLITDLQGKVGPFETSIIAETRTLDEYLSGLYNGTSDFFICYRDPSFTIDVDPALFPSLELGIEKVRPYQRQGDTLYDLDSRTAEPINYAEYSGTSFMSRVIQNTLARAPFRDRLRSVYRASLAESICTAVQQGFGVGWLPDSIAENSPAATHLACISDRWTSSLTISIYRSRENTKPRVNQIWQSVGTHDTVGQ